MTRVQLPFTGTTARGPTPPNTHTRLHHGATPLPRKLRPLPRRTLAAIDPSCSGAASHAANATWFFFHLEGGGCLRRAGEAVAGSERLVEALGIILEIFPLCTELPPVKLRRQKASPPSPGNLVCASVRIHPQALA